MSLSVLLLTHYYAPEVGAPQTRLRETVRMLTERGVRVRIVTGQPHYPGGTVRDGYSALRITRERIDGISVLRLPVVARPYKRALDRILDQTWSAFVSAAVVEEATKADVLLVESPPLFFGITAGWLRVVTGRPYVLHVADPWPDYPIELGILRSPLAIRAARSIERLSYRMASVITTPTDGCAEMIKKQISAHGKVHVLPNGVDLDRFAAIPKSEARDSVGWSRDAFVFLYAGTVGLAQGLTTLVEAASLLENELEPSQAYEIRVVGDGADRSALQRRANDLGLRKIQFEDPVAAANVPLLMAAADVGLVLLRRGKMADAALPTKLVETLAAGLPVVASAEGEAARLVEQSGAGVVSDAEDARGLATSMAGMIERDKAPMARAARQITKMRFDRRAVVRRLHDLLRQAAGGAAAPD